MGTAKYLIAKKTDHNWGAVISTVGIQETPAGESYPYGEHPKKYIFSHISLRTEYFTYSPNTFDHL